ncbi:hypothetical protein Ancab_010169 [Ancistrocladus abbreviatus]
MFPSERSFELSFQISNLQEDNQTPQIYDHDRGLISTDHDVLLSNICTVTTARKGQHQRPRSSGDKAKLIGPGDGTDDSGNGNSNKKITHREIERQRRQEMTKLFSSLRALLPLDYIKGKRSLSDHVMEATNYINKMQKSNRELRGKRDALLKRSSNSADLSSARDCVVIQEACSGESMGFKITIIGIREESLHLSTLLNIMLEEGLDVVSCVSTKANEKWVHVVHSQVNENSCLDSSRLQEQLTNGTCAYNS